MWRSSGLLVACLLGGLLSAWSESEGKSCSPGCEEIGNCNRELGVCECPIGRTGPACEQWIMGACRPSAESPVAWIGEGVPKNCHCRRQIMRWARRFEMRPGAAADARRGNLVLSIDGGRAPGWRQPAMTTLFAQAPLEGAPPPAKVKFCKGNFKMTTAYKFAADFAVAAIESLKESFFDDDPSLDILACFTIFDPVQYIGMGHAELDDFGNDSFQQLKDHFWSGDGLPNSPFSARGESFMATLDTEFKHVKTVIKDRLALTPSATMLNLWRFIARSSDSLMVPNIILLMNVYYVMALHTAEVERGFSIHRILKNRLRSRLMILMVDSLLRIWHLAQSFTGPRESENNSLINEAAENLSGASLQSQGVNPPSLLKRLVEEVSRVQVSFLDRDLDEAARLLEKEGLEDVDPAVAFDVEGNIVEEEDAGEPDELDTCYQLADAPKDEQFSDPPADLSDPRYQWMVPTRMLSSSKEYEWMAPKPPEASIEELWKAEATENFFPEHQGGVQPLDKCTKRCNERGFCSASGSCHCAPGWTGTACEDTDTLRGCPFHGGCNGGECIAGWCKCPAGRWGSDCTRSKVFTAGDAGKAGGQKHERTKLRIYRYELPWNIAFPYTRYDGRPATDNALYLGVEQFYKAFSSDWTVRTENPFEANLFYVPARTHFFTTNTGNPMASVAVVMAYVKATYPQLWARNEGRDHFIWLPQDIGACWLLNTPEQQNPIKVVHWGLQVSSSNCTGMPHCWWLQQWKDIVNTEYSCFKDTKDVVSSPYMDDVANELSLSSTVYTQALAGEKRRYLLYFGGAIRPNQKEYSGGARQAFDTHVASKGHPEVKFGGSRITFREATFCFAPYGDGWGSRLMHAMQAGCIPVIVQEHVHQPYDDVLDYSSFSIRLAVDEVPGMVDTLKRVSNEQIQRYQQAMHGVHQAFSWEPQWGGQAYNFTLASLRKKLDNLSGESGGSRRSLLAGGGAAHSSRPQSISEWQT
ncbi:hypothetical protein FOA52_001147 [Chlamydomonas sp. UWO 241]|nr:hypothetical protein FOA52_001147 [Chlamydomonas sp. UWO 241]